MRAILADQLADVVDVDLRPPVDAARQRDRFEFDAAGVVDERLDEVRDQFGAFVFVGHGKLVEKVGPSRDARMGYFVDPEFHHFQADHNGQCDGDQGVELGSAHSRISWRWPGGRSSSEL